MLKMALFDCAINKKMLQCWTDARDSASGVMEPLP